MTPPSMDPFVEQLELFLALGLPDPPARLPETGDVEIPLALWREGDIAAVLWVEREAGSTDLDSRVDVFCCEDAHGWRLLSSGGGSWIGDWDVPVPAAMVGWMGHAAVVPSPSTGKTYWLAGGRAGSDVRAIGYRGPHVEGIIRITSKSGVFFFGVESPPRFQVGPIYSITDPVETAIRTMSVQRTLGLTR